MSVLEHSLVTPEGVPLTFQLAEPFERLGAFVIDMVLLTLSIVLLMIGLGLALPVGVPSDIVFALILLGLFVVRNGYFVFFEAQFGGSTPGKRLLRLRVVARDGGGLGTEAVFARNLLRDIELFGPLVALTAPRQIVGSAPFWLALSAALWLLLVSAMPLLTRRRQRAGDLVADTLVVRVPMARLQVDEAAPASRSAGGVTFTTKQLSVYGEFELETLADLLRQSEERADTTDLVIVARTIAQKIGYSGPEPMQTPERFLRAFYRAQRAALERRLLLGHRKADKHDRQ